LNASIPIKRRVEEHVDFRGNIRKYPEEFE
jgi:hypothetical protein